MARLLLLIAIALLAFAATNAQDPTHYCAGLTNTTCNLLAGSHWKPLPKPCTTTTTTTPAPCPTTTKDPYDRSGVDQKPYRVALAITQAVTWTAAAALLLGLGWHQTQTLTTMASTDEWPPNWDGVEVHNDSQPLAPLDPVTPIATPADSPVAAPA